ncbi:MAG: hypothetical protein HC867_09475 [Bacteroidia bacterium]|nr:hypothetical protein [Bacteroidia bacterium]
MVNSFKSHNPLNIIILFVYGLLLKYSSFTDPSVPIAQSTDGFLYHTLLWYLKGVGANALLFILLLLISLCLHRPLRSATSSATSV